MIARPPPPRVTPNMSFPVPVFNTIQASPRHRQAGLSLFNLFGSPQPSGPPFGANQLMQPSAVAAAAAAAFGSRFLE